MRSRIDTDFGIPQLVVDDAHDDGPLVRVIITVPPGFDLETLRTRVEQMTTTMAYAVAVLAEEAAT